MKTLARAWSYVLIAAVVAVPTALTAQVAPKLRNAKHHRYKLIDLGAFGGPQSSIVDTGIPNGMVVNNDGNLVGFADTSSPDPSQAFCFLDCFVDHSFQWQHDRMTDIGVLAAGWSSAATAISANGLIAGFAQNGELDSIVPGFPELRAVVWKNGVITDLGTLPEGGYESAANDVNSHGQVVGVALNTTLDANPLTLTLNDVYGVTQVRAFLWEGDELQDLGTLGGTDALAARINERGQVMGWSYTSMTQAGTCFPVALGSFLWDRKNGMRDLGSFGGTCTEAWDLNNRGQVVGFSNDPSDTYSRAFLWEDGAIHDMGGSLGGNATGAFAINDAGHAAGFGYLAGDTFFHAAFWKKAGTITDLGTVGDDPCSSAKAINAKDQVVGDSISLSSCLGSGDATRAFLWENGVIFDLNALIPPDSPLYLVHPQTINDRGAIAGVGVDADGNQHAFLLLPCDGDHPNVEGCDYSNVDVGNAPSVYPVARGTSVSTRPAAFWRRNNRAHFPTLGPRQNRGTIGQSE